MCDCVENQNRCDSPPECAPSGMMTATQRLTLKHTMMMMISSACTIQYKHKHTVAHAEHFAHRDDFAVGCYASYHSMDGLFVVTRIKENFNQSWTALCDANQMKSEEEAAATLLQEIRRRNFNAILQPGAMRWFNHCTVYFSVGVDCLVSHLKHTVSLCLCLCVYALLNSTEFT